MTRKGIYHSPQLTIKSKSRPIQAVINKNIGDPLIGTVLSFQSRRKFKKMLLMIIVRMINFPQSKNLRL